MKINISLAIISLASSLIFLISSCTTPVTPTDETPSTMDTISRKAAYRMIQHYRDSAVMHYPGELVRMIRLQNSVLKGICDLDGTTSFWTAADTNTHKLMLIVQSKSTGGGSTFMAVPGEVCPPPTTPPCDTTFAAEFQ